MSSNTDVQLIKNGKRLSGRKLEDLREIKIQPGVLDNADGSCYLEWGNNKVIAAVYGPKEAMPRHTQNPLKAVMNYKYNMAPFSVEDRKRPGPDRRSTEISKISGAALSKVVLLEKFPNMQIDVFVDVLQADAGTRCAALSAASVALADAGIPMTSLIACCAAGKIDNKVVVDLDKPEDNHGQADVPMAVIPRTEEIVLLQMDGHLTADEFKTAMRMAIDGSKKVNEIQIQALKEKYQGELNGD
ncbi:MAG: exosome complex exonuclease Rrp41 [DPANN group archaeon]|nr:exosome complex exonuclease Rrp41 [DPANN group archaeon]